MTIRNAAIIGAILVIVLLVGAALQWGLNKQRHEYSLQERACSQSVRLCTDDGFERLLATPTPVGAPASWDKFKAKGTE